MSSVLVITIVSLGVFLYTSVGAQKRNFVFDTRVPHSPNLPRDEREDIGRLINFKTIDPMGNRCAMVYGGPSLGLDGFLIQDCGGSGWTNQWSYGGGGFVKRMSFLSERIGWFVIGHGLVKVERIDDALQATVVRNEPDQNIESVFFVNELYGWICGDKGMISQTDDGGVTWKRQESNTDLNLKEIRFTNSLEGWASGSEYRNGRSHGALVTTRDGGAHWTPVKSKEARSLSAVFFTSSYTGCGIDDSNSILCTHDGETWRKVYSDRVGHKLKTAIFFSSEKQGWAVGDGIWHTSDGGETWRAQLSMSDGSHELRSVVFLDDQLGWAQSLDAVWRTRDAGKTWLKISDTWIRRMNTKASDISARGFNLRPLTPASPSALTRNFAYPTPTPSSDDYRYSIRGRVVDAKGHPVTGAVVYLDPLMEADQVFGGTSDESGNFHLEETTTVPRKQRRLYVTAAPAARTVALITPPFNLLPRLTEPRFSGRNVTVYPNTEIDLGEVPLQIHYGIVETRLDNCERAPLLSNAEEWRYLYLRLRNGRNRIVTDTTLSQNDILRAVDVSKSTVTMSLPEGAWWLEVSTGGYGGPWLRSSNPIFVNAKTPQSLDLNLCSKDARRTEISTRR